MPTWKHEYQRFRILQCYCSRNMMWSEMKYLLRLFESSLEVPVIIALDRHFEMEWYCWELRQFEWERNKQIEWLWHWSFDGRVCMWVRNELILICYENNFGGRSIGPFVHPSIRSAVCSFIGPLMEPKMLKWILMNSIHHKGEYHELESNIINSMWNSYCMISVHDWITLPYWQRNLDLLLWKLESFLSPQCLTLKINS
jgi:hypothetical protein